MYSGRPDVRLRGYQTEMLEASIQGNKIVVLDTGSGKTLIAIERAAYELERCDSSKRVWMLVPGVALGHQQSRVFREHLPAYQVRFLSGEDNVDTWSDRSTWNTILTNIRIVISTHQVLLDALTHGFVRLSELSLLIFDEAHHTRGRHPANMIMQQFYHVSDRRSALPSVLGLSASPVMKADPRELSKTEENLDALAVTTRVHATELLQHVHRPILECVPCSQEMSYIGASQGLLTSLHRAFANLDIRHDPYVLKLRRKARDDRSSRDMVYRAFLTRSTYCQDAIKSMLNRALHIHQELGRYSSDWYIRECITRFFETLQSSEPARALDSGSYGEQLYLFRFFQKVLADAGQHVQVDDPEAISHKVAVLLDLLRGFDHSTFAGLVFVEQRATAVTLANFLSSHPHTNRSFKVGRFVGMSTGIHRKTSVADLSEPRIQQQDLADFRAGGKNLIVSTNALEEGIDVSECNAVICLDEPKNLKSFVQRRGRARKQSSRYIIMLPKSQTARHDWESLEEAMKQACLNDERRIQLALEREKLEEIDDSSFRIPSTGALLTTDNAVAHLNHFCAVIAREVRYTDTRPAYTFNRTDDDFVTAEVTLPLSVNAACRMAKSTKPRRTEKAATKDAAFTACLQLHHAGLLNDHLLPGDANMMEIEAPEKIQSMVDVQKTWNPWKEVARRWLRNPSSQYIWHKYLFKLDVDGSTSIEILFPDKPDKLASMILHLNRNKVILDNEYLGVVELSGDELASYRCSTNVILRSIFGRRVLNTKVDHLLLLGPSDVLDASLRMAWSKEMDGARPAAEVEVEWPLSVSRHSLVREVSKPSKQWTLQGFIRKPDGELFCQVGRFSKRRDVLHPSLNEAEPPLSDESSIELLAKECLVDNIPAALVKFAICIPTISFKWTTSMVATLLQKSLPELVFKDHTWLHTAITAPCALDTVSYEQVEFLGDCLLKFCTSLSLSAQHPDWPEAFLTDRKSRIVSNSSLARAAIELGLERHIVYTAPIVAKWRPKYASNYKFADSDRMNPDRMNPLSSKTIADVVEALIGAVYLDTDSDIFQAERAIRTLLPEESWIACSQAIGMIYHNTPHHGALAESVSKASQVVGYQFNKPLLLREALTHPSYSPPASSQEYELSYQRLEYLGDAVLDLIVVRRLFELGSGLRHHQLHSLRASIVNRHILAFLCMELSAEEEHYAIKLTPDGKGSEPARTQVAIPLWAFMRKGGAEIAQVQNEAVRNQKSRREQIWRALRTASRYPWALLEFGAPKFFSDLVESILGAIYVDSRGDLGACTAFLERLGLLALLQRLTRDSVEVLHPKERVGIVAGDEKVKYARVGEYYSVTIGERTFETPAETETQAATHALRQVGVYQALDGEMNPCRAGG